MIHQDKVILLLLNFVFYVKYMHTLAKIDWQHVSKKTTGMITSLLFRAHHTTLAVSAIFYYIMMWSQIYIYNNLATKL